MWPPASHLPLLSAWAGSGSVPGPVKRLFARRMRVYWQHNIPWLGGNLEIGWDKGPSPMEPRPW